MERAWLRKARSSLRIGLGGATRRGYTAELLTNRFAGLGKARLCRRLLGDSGPDLSHSAVSTCGDAEENVAGASADWHASCIELLSIFTPP